MNKLTLVVLLIALLAGCASKTTHKPVIREGAEIAKLTFVRTKVETGPFLSYGITIDDRLAVLLGAGEYTTIPVEAGPHAVSAISCVNPPHSQVFEGGKEYYFLLSAHPGYAIFDLNMIPQDNALRWIADSKEHRE